MDSWLYAKNYHAKYMSPFKMPYKILFLLNGLLLLIQGFFKPTLRSVFFSVQAFMQKYTPMQIWFPIPEAFYYYTNSGTHYTV